MDTNMDDALPQQPDQSLREKNRRLATIDVVLAVAVIVLNLAIPTGDGYHLTGEPVKAGSSEMTQAIFVATLASMPLAAALLALGVAILPYRGLPYTKKYLRAFLLTLMGIYSIFVALSAIGLVRYLLGS